MKYIGIILLLACTFNAIGQNTIDEKALYVMKSEKYRRMKNTGAVMMAVGGVMSVVGIVKMSNAEYYTDIYGNQTSDDPQATTGALLFLIGAPVCGGGVVLTIIGSKSMKKYNQKLEGLSLNLKLAPNQSGMALTFKF
jgi:hypothetical protein